MKFHWQHTIAVEIGGGRTIGYSLVPFRWWFCAPGEMLLAGRFSALRIVRSFMKWSFVEWAGGRFGLPRGLCASWCKSIDCNGTDGRRKENCNLNNPSVHVDEVEFFVRYCSSDRSIKIINGVWKERKRGANRMA